MIGRVCLTRGKFGWDWALLDYPCLLEESQQTEILLTGSLSLNSINKQVRALVTGLFALIFDSKTINIFAYFFTKNPNPIIKNKLSIIRTGKEPVTKICY